MALEQVPQSRARRRGAAFILAIDRIPSLQVRGAHAREALLNEQLDCCNYAYEYGIDKPEIVDWRWPL